MPPSWGANALLHPSRHAVTKQPSRPFEAIDWPGDGVQLKGWWFHTLEKRRGTVVVLHGVSDNRASSLGIADHFLARGFDVLAYDSRAHGESTGDACTYGYYEKHDLSRVLDHLDAGPVVLFGTSMGAAVALQTAAEDPRVSAVVSLAAFSDLRTAAVERAPFFASKGNLADAFKIAEAQGHFRVDEVSPMAAAAHIRVPVMIIHGRADNETPYPHAVRIFAALSEPKRLVAIPDCGHRDCLTGALLGEIDQWMDQVVPR